MYFSLCNALTGKLFKFIIFLMYKFRIEITGVLKSKTYINITLFFINQTNK